MKVLFVLSVVLLILKSVESRKKKKQKRKKVAENPLDRRPTKVSPELYCDACIAIVKENIKILRNSKRESDVYDAIDNVCDPERYYTYHHPPPEMREGCEAFISGWEEELIQALVNRENNEAPVQTLCYEISKACQGVDPANVSPMDKKIMIDGQPVDIVRDLIYNIKHPNSYYIGS